MSADLPGRFDPVVEQHHRADRVVDAGGPPLGAVQQPAGEIPNIDHLGRRLRRIGNEHRLERTARGASDPIAGPVTAVAGTADQARPGDQQGFGSGPKARELARDLRLSVELDADLVAIRGRQQLSALVGTSSGVRGVDATRGDVDPVACPPAQRRQRFTHHTRVPAQLDDRIPLLAGGVVVGSGLSAVCSKEPGAIRDRTALAPCKTDAIDNHMIVKARVPFAKAPASIVEH